MRFLGGLLCALFLTSVPLPAEDAGSSDSVLVLTLAGATDRALEHSINLQKNRISLEEKEYASKHLWAEVFPSIRASADISYRTPLFTGPAAGSSPAQRFSYGTSVSLSLNLSAGIPSRIKLLGLAYQQQLLSYEDTRRLLEIATAQSFYTLAAERENLTQLDETLGLAERQLERHRVGRANGMISEMTLLQSQLAVETARYNLSSAQASYSNSLGDFLSSLGLSPETPVSLEGEFEIRRIELDPEELIRDYLPRRPDIEQQRRVIEELELTKRQRVLEARAPSIAFSFNWSGGSGNTGITGPFTDTISGTASLSIPVNSWIPGTTESQTLRAAENNIEKALLDLKNTQDAAAGQIRSLTANLRNSWESLEIARLREQIARRSYELTERGFLNGTVESLALETNRNNLADARLQLLQSEVRYQNLVLDLARAVNVDWRQLTRSEP
ncbi:MAG: TolC family protein [Treponema sp.]|jgi:multidrug efflux system outer membrane protein|nr:TolC family protein [Treponema sp.]